MRSAPVLLLALALLAGCGEDVETPPQAQPSPSSASPTPTADDTPTGGGTGTASPSPPRSPSATATQEPGDDVSGDTDGLPFEANTEPDTAEASSDALLSVTDVRIGRHETDQGGFDRVVLELDGTGSPGWRVAYTDRPSQQGSGFPIDLPGDTALEVILTGVGYPFDVGVEEYAGPGRVAVASTEIVTEVLAGSVFEGQHQAFIGLADEVPFRAYRLESPARVVIEVARP